MNNRKKTINVILKADDFAPVTFKSFLKGVLKFHINSLGWIHSTSIGWKRYIKFSLQKNLRTDFGIVGTTLKFLSKDSSFVIDTKYLLRQGNGIWNHGYTHKMDEFQGKDIDFQLNHIQKTNILLKKLFGIDNISFGAPGNNIDDNTSKAIVRSENTIWFFGNINDRSYLLLKRLIDLENPTCRPNFEFFKTELDKLTQTEDIDNIVLQIHPNQWRKIDYTEFSKCIEYLHSKFFVTFCSSSFLFQEKSK